MAWANPTGQHFDFDMETNAYKIKVDRNTTGVNSAEFINTNNGGKALRTQGKVEMVHNVNGETAVSLSNNQAGGTALAVTGNTQIR